MNACLQSTQCLVTAAVEEHRLPDFFGNGQVAPHQVWPAQADLIAVALAPHDPGHRGAIGQGQVCLTDHRVEVGVLAGGHHRVNIAQRDITGLVLGPPGHDARQDVFPVQCVDLRVEHMRAAACKGYTGVEMSALQHPLLVDERLGRVQEVRIRMSHATDLRDVVMRCRQVPSRRRCEEILGGGPHPDGSGKPLNWRGACHAVAPYSRRFRLARRPFLAVSAGLPLRVVRQGLLCVDLPCLWAFLRHAHVGSTMGLEEGAGTPGLSGGREGPQLGGMVVPRWQELSLPYPSQYRVRAHLMSF